MRLSALLVMIFALTGCGPNEGNEKLRPSNPEIIYARTLDIIHHEDFSIIKIIKPWQQGENEVFSYLALRNGGIVPDSLMNLPLLKVPLQSVVTFSTTHIGFISSLEKTKTIKAVSGKDYFYDSDLRKLLNDGNVYDIGYSPTIDYETIVKIQPGIVFLYALGASEASVIKRLADAGIPAIMISEFLEPHPLGKAEWIKLFACLYDVREKGDSIFNFISENYHYLASYANNLVEKPKVLTGLPWKGTWNMAGGRSFVAQLIEDAGGEFLWRDNPSEEYIPLSLEAVYSRAGEAGVWINTGTAISLADLVSRDKRFENIPAVLKKKVFNNNARLNEFGGNDYWESGTLRPDLILRDLISIFHPEVAVDDELFYYRKLE